MFEQAASDFLMLFVTIEPFGALSMFVSLTSSLSPAERRKVAVRAVAFAAGILIAFLIVGQVLMSYLAIRLVSFQLAGGVILFLLGLQMVFGTGVAAENPQPEEGHDPTVFPLAIPLIAGPGAITAIVVLTDNHRQSIPEQALTGAMLVAVLAVTLLLFFLGNPIRRLLGRSGTNLVVRVMGILLAALAAEQIVGGIETLLAQWG